MTQLVSSVSTEPIGISVEAGGQKGADTSAEQEWKLKPIDDVPNIGRVDLLAGDEWVATFSEDQKHKAERIRDRHNASLRAALAQSEQEKRERWIAVSERMPNFDEIVWLYCGTGSPFIGGRTDDADGWLWANSYGAIWWNGERWDGDLETDDDYKPTHWMPLPTPPASDNHAEGQHSGAMGPSCGV